MELQNVAASDTQKVAELIIRRILKNPSNIFTVFSFIFYPPCISSIIMILYNHNNE